ncbi:hypothetical protein Q5P01_020641 [Channa striata]|uniref:Uncharacterized protein n=1 Tax=Channa striata TaxID=64152 RepID=A0AA88LY27_CHASR|nr:hypothetical protein Q5P01_020641 [Channa striata]
MERIKKLLEERDDELKIKEEEVIKLKDSKNRKNQAKAGLSYDDRTGINEANLESEHDQDSKNESELGDIMMERYFSSVPLAHSQVSVVNESFEHHRQLEISVDYSFELNSELLEDEPLFSISNRPLEENEENLHNTSSPQCFLPVADDGDILEMSKLSEQHYEDTDLEKELLNQQCGELREELALKDRDLNVLMEEVVKGAEDLEEARSRWAQVTEELRQALWELEEEKERRRHVEEEMNLKAHDYDNLKNKLSALTEEKENENAIMLMEKESPETAVLASDSSPWRREMK